MRSRENIASRTATSRHDWVASASLLLLLTSQIAAFSPVVKTRSLVGGISSVNPNLRFHGATRLKIASAESAADVGIDDLESLRGDDGIYNIVTGDQHKAFLKKNGDKLIVLKVFAPWCRACKGLEPKFQLLASEKYYKDLPILFSSISIQNNKDYIKSIGVLALPTVQFYKNGQLVDNFPCGPSKVPILKQKLADLVERCIDPTTGKVKTLGVGKGETLVAEKPAGTPPIAPSVDDQTTRGTTQHAYLTAEQIQYIRTKVPFFESLAESDFQPALQAAKILEFERGSVIMKEGNPGETFYVIMEGEVEICQRTAFEDPLIVPADYVGTVINRLKSGDWFGERALITGEPRAASIRVAENMRCVAFNQADLPPSCVLSGIPNKSQAGRDELKEKINEKYGLAMRELDDLETSKQIRESYLVNQKRGSANTPGIIYGVDTEEEEPLPVDGWDEQEDEALAILKTKSASIVPLLEKFKLIRLISRCFEYIVTSGAEISNPAVRRRRSLLASQLPKSQREEFVEAFHLVDTNGDGGISMAELQRVMETIGDVKSDDDLMEITPHVYSVGSNGEAIMNMQDFIGIMAEVEFYYLFRDVFASLDKRDAGFVKAADLDRVLCGVRDLISDDRHSIIDVEDKEMSIDYEQFTKMLLGLTL